MKKALLYLGCCIIVFSLVSCKGKPAKKLDETNAEVRMQLSLQLVVQLDSLAAEEIKYSFEPLGGKIQRGEFKLTEAQKKVKPDYLLSPSGVNDMHTLQQKNAAFIYYLMDRAVAKLYDMPTEAYDEVCARLQVDLNLSDNSNLFQVNPADREALRKQEEFFMARFKKEQQEGTLHLFVGRGVAMITESLYFLSQNPDVLAEALSDEEVAVFSHRLRNISTLLDKLLEFYPEIQPERNALSLYMPLVNATGRQDLVERVKLMKPQIEAMRASLIN